MPDTSPFDGIINIIFFLNNIFAVSFAAMLHIKKKFSISISFFPHDNKKKIVIGKKKLAA